MSPTLTSLVSVTTVSALVAILVSVPSSAFTVIVEPLIFEMVPDAPGIPRPCWPAAAGAADDAVLLESDRPMNQMTPTTTMAVTAPAMIHVRADTPPLVGSGGATGESSADWNEDGCGSFEGVVSLMGASS